MTEEQLIKSVVDRMRASRTFAIDNITNNNDGTWLIETQCTKDIVAGQYILIGATEVKVTAVVVNTSFTVKTSTDISAETAWSAMGPYFFYGNPIDIHAEISRKEQTQNRNYPAVILFELKDIQKGSWDSPVSVMKPQIFFMDQFDITNNTIQDLYDNRVNRMDALATEFIETLKSTRNIYSLTDSPDVSKWSKWNVVAIRSGVNGSQTIFSNNLSGVELNIAIPYSKDLNVSCENC